MVVSEKDGGLNTANEIDAISLESAQYTYGDFPFYWDCAELARSYISQKVYAVSNLT